MQRDGQNTDPKKQYLVEIWKSEEMKIQKAWSAN